jgi:glycosyltransferase involved in cell wall biosynthesis
VSLPIVVATIQRRRGETGIHAHVSMFIEALVARREEVAFVNHLSVAPWVGIPIFLVRRAIERVNPARAVWWYRVWHLAFLRLALWWHLRRRGPLVIYAQCPISARAALDTRRSPDQRVVMALHFSGSQADEWVAKGRIEAGGRVYRGIDHLERRTLPALDGIVYLARSMQHEIERRHPGVADVPAALIPNFTRRPAMPSTTSLEGDLITVGALDRNKNQAHILRVVAAAAAMGHGYRLSVVGDGPERRALEALVRELGIAPLVRFHGFRPDAASLIPRHVAYIHAARMDNFPMAIVEALAAGRPVLAPPVGGIPEMIDDGIEGRYIPLDDPEEGARIVVGLLEDEGSLARLGAAARDRFERAFDVDVVAPRLAAFLRQVGAAEPRAPAARARS